jgi:subtilase family serine protease
MTSEPQVPMRCKRWMFGGLAIYSLMALSAGAQAPERLTSDIDDRERVAIPGTHPPMARPENEVGRLPTGTNLRSMTIVLSRSSAQEADLQNLIAAQQDPHSPLYHKWLTPDEFASRFGVADSDLAKVRSWLEQQGFSIDSISRSKSRITFSGTVGQVEAGFSTELHYYNVSGKTHFAPAVDISVPAAFSSIIQTVANLSSFRPKPHVKLRKPVLAGPNFTSSQTGNHFLTPKDVAVIYDINPAYNAGYTGAGQSIAVVGQSSIVLSDVENFQNAAGLSKKDPTLVLVPNSGSAAISTGDEAESDLDLEYSSAIAKGATIYFVYTGNNPNYGVWDSISYAVDSKISAVISTSYGVCESALSSADYSTLNGVLAQAAAQGQSVVSASGDNGSEDCYGDTSLSQAQQESLAVDFPASSQYVTGMGGTEFPASDVSSSNTTYWASASGGDVISSALSYIPEQVWNDDSSTNGLSSGGGGVSSLTARPSWQSGVAGIPSGTYRLLPDISLESSPNNAGYLYCSSDSSTGITGSCSNGFRDSNNQYLTVAGGTSFASPIFSAMLAILNGKLNSTGEGVVNSTLYSLAADATTYSSAFHDITSGSNKCTAGSSYCSSAGASNYAAGTGYDQASGLGSIDFYNLLSAWPTSSSSPAQSTTTLSAATSTPSSGASDTITITVASASSSATATPTGTLTIAVDGTTQTSSLALSNGSATYGFSSTATGSHTITATYSGDSTYAASNSSIVVTVVSASGSFTVSATNLTISAGSSGTSTLTVTPKNGYTGTVAWSVSSSPSLSNACFSVPNATVSDTSAVSVTMTVYTSSSLCGTSGLQGASGRKRKISGLIPMFGRTGIGPSASLRIAQILVDAIVLILLALPGRRSRAVRIYAQALIVLVLGLTAWGCGSQSSSSASTTNAPKGTYTLTIVGSDSSSSITATTTTTLTIN